MYLKPYCQLKKKGTAKLKKEALGIIFAVKKKKKKSSIDSFMEEALYFKWTTDCYCLFLVKKKKRRDSYTYCKFRDGEQYC